MGVATSADAVAVPDALCARHSVVLDQEVHDDLERKLRGDGSAVPERVSGWEVFYDRVDFALSMRGFWLREKAGSWLLQFQSEDGKGMESMTDVEDILHKVGLSPFVETWKELPEGKRNLERMLAQAHVQPLARVFVERRVFQVSQEALGTASSSPSLVLQALAGSDVQLSVALESIRLDVGSFGGLSGQHTAHPQAIADLLFEHGAKARSHLRVLTAEFAASGSSLTAAASREAARNLIATLVKERGFAREADQATPQDTRAPPLKLLVFLRVLRPMDYKNLVRAGIIKDVSEAKDVAVKNAD